MTTINLKDFYAWYTHDEYVEISDEVAEELKADKRYEAAYRPVLPATRRSIRWTAMTALNIRLVCMSRPRKSWCCGRNGFSTCGTR
mgnify:CR=1 FL=1